MFLIAALIYPGRMLTKNIETLGIAATTHHRKIFSKLKG
jgi:hypothetical protein